MREIVPSRLWIGLTDELDDPAELDRLGVVAVVHLGEESTLPDLEGDSLCFHIPLLDGAGNDAALVDAAIDAVSVMLHARIPLLISCNRGQSRAPAIAAAAVALLDGCDPGIILRRISNGSHHHVNAELWREVLSCVESKRRRD